MKTLEEQIANKCIHFNGIMNDCCKAGIRYAEVRMNDKPYKFPCLKQGGECPKSQFLTHEEAKRKLAETLAWGENVLLVYVKAKDHFEKNKNNPGVMTCECGGELKYIVAETNGHMRAKCSACGLSFTE